VKRPQEDRAKPIDDPAPGDDEQPESDTNESSGEGIAKSDQWPPKEK
jgi:hypothetical protein